MNLFGVTEVKLRISSGYYDMKTYGVSGRIAPRFLDFCTGWRKLYPLCGKNLSGTCRVGTEETLEAV
jgi:hypothetical protein